VSVSKVMKKMVYGEQTLILETGEIARQATAAVVATMGDTTVLATVVGKKEAAPGQDFFPLTVNYQERTYAAGMIPGGFLKREGRPSENETLVSRLIDRPIRPLFPNGFTNEVQVVATVLSFDPEVNPDIVAMIASSAALAISGIPFNGPIGAARVGYRDGVYMLNPSKSHLEDSQLNLVVAGTETATLMVESEAHELSEQVMLGAVTFGQEMMQSVIQLINELASEVGKPRWDWQPDGHDQELTARVEQLAKADIIAAYQVSEKTVRQERLNHIRDAACRELCTGEEDAPSEQAAGDHISALEKKIVRGKVLGGEPRIDGRDFKSVRPISVRTGILPRAHGSALFTRGETQAIVTVTLGNERDAQIIDNIHGDKRDPFMLHYNFPPYCVGETGMMGSPKRREIGHGRLARRALEAVLPSQTDFPYVLRVVSEITESNGSSSMATVCGASLALMQTGVPISAPVAGIAMGLVKEGEQFAVLSDILGDEDHLGDMDFKVAGTENGITALQMDIKIEGITTEIMEQALAQARDGRLHILEIMNRHISKPSSEVSEHAPRILEIKINPDKIRDIIGKGGATIRSITDETGVDIDISDDGLVRIFSADQSAADAAVKRIEELTAEVEAGAIYEGTVARIVDFGAFVTVLPGKDGLLHISQIANERVENVNDYLKEGQKVKVKVLEIDRMGRVKLSMKALLPQENKQQDVQPQNPEGNNPSQEAVSDDSR